MRTVDRAVAMFALVIALFVFVASVALLSCNMSPPAASNANTNNSSISAEGFVPSEIINGVVVAATKKGPNRISYYRDDLPSGLYENIFVVDASMSDDDVWYSYIEGKLSLVRFTVKGVNYKINDPVQLAMYELKAKTLREQVIKEVATIMPPR